MRASRKRLLILLLSPVVFLLLLELAFRAAGLEPASPSPADVTGYFWINDEHLGFRNRPDGSFRYEGIASNPRVTTDRFGYRNGAGWDPDGEDPIVAFVGDSAVFCAEVDDDRTGPSEVHKALGADFDLRVLNAGVRGYGTLQAKRMLEECSSKFPEIVAVVYVFCGNDPLDDLDPCRHFPAVSPSAWWIADEGRLVEVEFKNPFVRPGQSLTPSEPWGRRGEGSRSVLSQIGEPLEGWRRELLAVLTELQGVREADEPREKRLDRELRDALRQRSAAFNRLQALVTGALGRRGLAPSAFPAEATWVAETRGREVLVTLLREMERTCGERGIDLLVTAFTRVNVENELLKASCLEAGVQFAPLHESFVDEHWTYAARRDNGTYDGHYGAKGTRTFAAALAPALREVLSARSGGNGSPASGFEPPR